MARVRSSGTPNATSRRFVAKALAATALVVYSVFDVRGPRWSSSVRSEDFYSAFRLIFRPRRSGTYAVVRA